jgi:hypothetical protein
MGALLGRIRLHALVTDETDLDAVEKVVAIGSAKLEHLACTYKGNHY